MEARTRCRRQCVRIPLLKDLVGRKMAEREKDSVGEQKKVTKCKRTTSLRTLNRQFAKNGLYFVKLL